MAASFEYETLEALLDKCTDPNTGKEDWRYINAFCDRVNKEYDGPLISTKLVIRKLQTFQEKTSLLALSVLEACVKNCGQKYHQEIGKFRFLNELIKLLSSKYDGNRTTQPVKSRIIELFYNWSVGLPGEAKIKEAYLMLKRQGVVKADPHLPSQVEQFKPSPKPRMAVFEDEDKAKLLARLLASKHPDDLQAANRLIKNMVRQDEVRVEKLTLRVQELEMVQNNVKLLNDMLAQYSVNSPKSDIDLMKELFDSCEKLRTDLFKLAGTATDEGDDTLPDILQANDNLTRVIEDYRRIVGTPGEPPLVPPHDHPPPIPPRRPQGSKPDLVTSNETSSNMSTLIDLDLGGGNTQQSSTAKNDTLSSDLQDLVLGGNIAPVASTTTPAMTFPTTNTPLVPGPTLQRPQLPPAQNLWSNTTISTASPTISIPVGGMRGVHPGVIHGMGSPTIAPSQGGGATWSSSVVNRMKPDEQKPKEPSPFDLLGKTAMEEHKAIHNITKVEEVKKDSTLLDLDMGPSVSEQATSANITTPTLQPPLLQPPPGNKNQSNTTPLEELSISMDKIQPGNLPPMNVLDKDNIKTIIHFAKDSSGSLRSDIHVIVVSTLSTNTTPLKNFSFQCAAPKSMKLKLQPPTSNELPAYNPLLPPSAITQVMLLANPAKDRIRLKFRISYELNGNKANEMGDLDNFPIL